MPVARVVVSENRCPARSRGGGATRLSIAVFMLLFGLLPMGSAHACSLADWGAIGGAGDHLSTTQQVRFEGACALDVSVDGGNPAFVRDDTPAAIPPVWSYVARFYALFDDLSLADGDSVEVFSGHGSDDAVLFKLVLLRSGATNLLYLVATDDGGAEASTAGNGIPVPRGWRALELTWMAASADGEADGSLVLRLDGVPGTVDQVLTGLDNDTWRVAYVRLGAVGGGFPGSSGVLTLDSFRSQRNGQVGLVVKNCSGEDVLVDNTTFLPGLRDCFATDVIRAGGYVVLDPGAQVTFNAPRAVLKPGFSVANGARLRVVLP